MIDKANNVRGYFKYTLRDSKTGKIVDQYEAPNQIMSQVPKMYFELVSGLQTPGTIDASTGKPKADVSSTLKKEAFQLCAVVLGDQGAEKLLDGQGKPVMDTSVTPPAEVFVPKTINPDDRVIGAMKKVNGKFAGTSYQATWEKLTEHESVLPKRTDPEVGCKIQTEGMLSDVVKPTIPLTDFNGAGKNSTSASHTEQGLDVVSEVRDGVITFNFTLLEKTGNGIDFSEAALYVRHNQDPAFNDGTPINTDKLNGGYEGDPRNSKTPGYAGSGIPSLGTIFSMKTFKPVKKTTACVLEMEWKLDFNL